MISRKQLLPDKQLAALLARWEVAPPTEDDLPYADDVPLDSELQRLQMNLLIDPLRLHWAGRQDTYVGGNQFLYYSADQVRRRNFLGPDVLVATGVTKRVRKSWVVWQEGKPPDLAVEILSPTSARRDRTSKKQLYQDEVGIPEYYWCNPDTGEHAGFVRREGAYEPAARDALGRYPTGVGLLLVPWRGVYMEADAHWLRWAMPDGVLLPTGEELAAAAQAQVEAERARADAAERRLAEVEALLARYQGHGGPPAAP